MSVSFYTNISRVITKEASNVKVSTLQQATILSFLRVLTSFTSFLIFKICAKLANAQIGCIHPRNVTWTLPPNELLIARLLLSVNWTVWLVSHRNIMCLLMALLIGNAFLETLDPSFWNTAIVMTYIENREHNVFARNMHRYDSLLIYV